MAGSHRAAQRFVPCAALILLLIFSQALKHKWQETRHKRRILDSTEMPVEHIDPSAIDLTPLVNALINSSQSGSRQLFSLLSVTSYSSLALHKLTLLVYNISSIKNVESNMFRRRFCYCVTNDTNDLTGGIIITFGLSCKVSSSFDVLLLRLHSHSAGCDGKLHQSPARALQVVLHRIREPEEQLRLHLHLCDGREDGEVLELWDFNAAPPLFNQTIIEGPHRANISSFRLPVEWHQLPTNLSHISPSGTSSLLTSRVQSTADESLTVEHENAPTALVTPARALATPPRTTPPLATPQRATPPRTTPPLATPQRATPPQTTPPLATPQRATPPQTTPPLATPPRTTPPLATPQRATPSQTTPPLATPPRTTPPLATPPPAAETTPRWTSPRVTAALQPSPAAAPPPSTLPVSAVGPLPTAPPTPAALSPVVGPTQTATDSQPTTHAESGRTTIPSRPEETEKPGCPWRRPERVGGVSPVSTTVAAHKLQPCVLELCRFFSQCLCRPSAHKARMKRYCDDSHLWYERHTSELCRRVRRISFSRNLKQRCLTKMCSKL
ncbi:HERV-H LTR-associating protein 1 isoform X2 [Betta splendens]|uniref:HERV-H LTR-associating protein 1 isoform X2 n=1 Tax=Betta splendens TaxID=158456 RepID=A0A9W2XDP6_BETSP|nr:HERV-H LTR-associating protein 1 isoform X2 [Betta splendens]